MLLDEKSLETIAIAISIAAGCEPCTRYHVKAAGKLGATPLEMMHMAAVAGVGRCEQSPMALAIGDVCSLSSNDSAAAILDRHASLASIGVAVCLNSVHFLRDTVKAAQHGGATDEEIMEVIGLATRIKEKAASHLDKIVDRLDADRSSQQVAATLCT